MSNNLADFDGSAAAPPRANGELVFEEPWEMRAFGLAADLVDAGHFSWDDFREQLIASIGMWEASADADRPAWSYYRCWLEALEHMVDRTGLTPADALESRVVAYAARPPDHDH